MTKHTAGSPAVDVVFEEKRILVVLKDGRSLAAPIAWVSPTVVGMDAAGRAGWVLTNEGMGINWPAAGQSSPEGAIDVWTLEQDALFEQALAELAAADWQVSALSPRSRSLVALWRLVADGYNGGLLQFLGNWGIPEIHAALAALAEVGAERTLDVVRTFWEFVGPIAESAEVTTMDDVYAAIARGDSGRLDNIDEEFWEAALELTRRVPLTFGPAPSAV